MSFLEQTGVNN